MIIRFAKGKKGKHPTLTCLRDDGTSTWQNSNDTMIRHDLIHYAVEKTLGYRQAFYGLVEGGRSIESFGTKDGVKDAYPQEAVWTECLTGIIQYPSISGKPLSPAECLNWLQQVCIEHNMPAPKVTVEQIAVIQTIIADLHRQWGTLPQGGILELTF